MASQSTEPLALTLEISFRYFSGGINSQGMLEATLPNGAKFVFDPFQLHGKLGVNLQLFTQGAKAAASPAGTENAITAKPPEWGEALITRVAPGRAYGVDAVADARAKTQAKVAKQRAVEDLLSSIQIEF